MSDQSGLPPKLDDSNSASTSSRWSRLPRWSQWLIAIAAVVVLLVIGGAISNSGSKEDDLKKEVASLESEVSKAQNEVTAAQKEVKTVESAESGITKKAKIRASEITEEAAGEAKQVAARAETEAAEANRQASKVQSELASREAEAKSMESRIANLRGEEGEAKEIAAKSEIEDGVWEAERDFVPGTYEAPGGSACYWALLSEPGGGGIEGIIENGGFNKHQILNIESPYFETQGCGTWHRVG